MSFRYNTRSTIQKFGKLDSIKVLNFCFAKETVERMKRQIIDQENIFAKHISEKGLVFKIPITHFFLITE